MPTLTSDKGGLDFFPEISEDELYPGEECAISYKGEIDLNHGDFGELSFVSNQTIDGLAEAEKELNAGIEGITNQYAEEEERLEQERREAEEEKERAAEEAQSAIHDCVGKTAEEAYKTAEDVGYHSSFTDASGNEVKYDRNKNDVKGAKVTAAEIAEACVDYRKTIL